MGGENSIFTKEKEGKTFLFLYAWIWAWLHLGGSRHLFGCQGNAKRTKNGIFANLIFLQFYCKMLDIFFKVCIIYTQYWGNDGYERRENYEKRL